jgi:hypothetical protein
MQWVLIVVVILASLSMCSKLDEVNKHLDGIERELGEQQDAAPQSYTPPGD